MKKLERAEIPKHLEAALKYHLPYHMELKELDAQIVARTVGVGIDAYLEAYTQSEFTNAIITPSGFKRLTVRIANAHEMGIMLRRLLEQHEAAPESDEGQAALNLRVGILLSIGLEEA